MKLVKENIIVLGGDNGNIALFYTNSLTFIHSLKAFSAITNIDLMSFD